MRKLAVTAFAFSAAIFAADYMIPYSILLWFAGGFVLLGVGLLLCRQKWMLGFVLTALGMSVGFLWFFLHAQWTLIPAQELDGESLEVSGTVLCYPRVYDDYAQAEVRLTDEDLPGVKVLVYGDTDALGEWEPGDTIRGTLWFKRADLRYGERYDSYLARDLYLTTNLKGEPERKSGGFSLRFLPARLNRTLVEMADAVFPEDAAPFMKSLMLGDRTDLYRDVSLPLALSRAGFMHIIAVSGMHVAFLVGLLQLLLGKTRRSSLLCLLLVWFFVFLTGASPSALRAAIMQSFLLAAPLVRRENDPATSLAAALALILLVNPYAASSVSLQLSFSAMAGILCFAEPLQRAIESIFPEHWARRLQLPISTAASSLAVLVFSVPLSAIHFHSIALLSPLTNLLGLWAVSFCFCGGYLACLLGFLALPLGRILAWLSAWLARFLFLVARGVASVPFASLYVKGLFPVLWIVMIYLICGLMVFGRLRTWIKFLFPIAAAALTLALMLGVSKHNYRSGAGIISVIDVGQGQCVAVMSGEQTLVIDCGATYTMENAGEEAGSYLLSCGRDRVDVLVLTHLHKDHCNGVTALMELLPVERLILPKDVPDEDGLLEEIISSAEEHGTEILYLEEDDTLSLGNIRARLFAPGEQGDANERCLTALISLGDYDMLLTGDSNKSQEHELLEKHPLRDVELLIVGHHGSRYASAGELLSEIGADTAVISVGINPYGHPTYETLERLIAYGYTVYRTDLNGTVEFRLRADYG